MNAVVRALFDDAAITGAQAAGLKDTSCLLYTSFGVCVRCQRRDAAPGRAQCVYCLARSRRYMQSRLREKGVMPRDMLGWPGICSRCGKPTDTQEAHKLCPACREASQRAMEIARNSRTEKNWFARTHSLMARQAIGGGNNGKA